MSVWTRVDRNVGHYLTTLKKGPRRDDVRRRVRIDYDTKQTIQDIDVADQPIGYNWHAPLPPNVHNIVTR
eukprot:6071484-Pyramimonas_sp.AAC.1